MWWWFFWKSLLLTSLRLPASLNDLRHSKETRPVLPSEGRETWGKPSLLVHKDAITPTTVSSFADRCCLHIIWSCGWMKCVIGEESPKALCPVPGWLSTGLSAALCLFRALWVVRAYLPEVSSPKAKTSPDWLSQPLKVSQCNGQIVCSNRISRVQGCCSKELPQSFERRYLATTSPSDSQLITFHS